MLPSEILMFPAWIPSMMAAELALPKLPIFKRGFFSSGPELPK